ncbi:cupin-like domain-containing protein [Sphingomonas sp. CFBP 13706]|uniref:cupin-like domain-containing protein n=1 Tax=Sphingomonas sp. CFBP 13706 TaxID=2775314 RepID=UPI001FCF7DE5|nr:cupin-like domain-containing protein [Sphingomonas sp. CFBP 13706]
MSNLDWARPLAERARVDSATFEAEILNRGEPVVLRAQVSAWPSVVAARGGARHAAHYMEKFDGGVPVQVMAGRPEIQGRFFYDDAVQGFNFNRQMVPLRLLLSELLRFENDPAAPVSMLGLRRQDSSCPAGARQTRST